MSGLVLAIAVVSFTHAIIFTAASNWNWKVTSLFLRGAYAPALMAQAESRYASPPWYVRYSNLLTFSKKAQR